MQPIGRRILGIGLGLAFVVLFWGETAATVHATDVLLKDGRTLRGKLGHVSGIAESPKPFQADGNTPPQLILFLDDQLRRTFVSDRLVMPQQDAIAPADTRLNDEKFVLRKHGLRSGRPIAGVGQPLHIEPFDKFGRRVYTITTAEGTVDVLQEITEMTPLWTKVESTSHVWDMRIATSSIPRDILETILLTRFNPKEPEDFKKIARFYNSCERYAEARHILEKLLKEHPDQPNLKEDLEPSLRLITQSSAQQMAKELRLRLDAGQHQFVGKLLKGFPSQGVGGEILQQVREMIQDSETLDARRKDVVNHIKAVAAKLQDTVAKENLKPILEEIAAEIGPNTLDCMAPFLQFADDPEMSDAKKVSLAISGWILGKNAATTELSTSISAYKTRRLILEYLNEPLAPNREMKFSYIKQESGGEPSLVAEILAHMKPPSPLPDPAANKPGYFQLEVTGLAKEPPVVYRVQLPPEYDPHRLYPTILTLHGEASNADKQIDWWAGEWKNGGRAGQATRFGYIVIAPEWTAEHQKQYGYSAREHAAVLNSLRDACRRFSIDTDRVYLSGHSMGGDAAWDIGLAHPDLWAGVLPVTAQSDRYCPFYRPNAKYVPFYFVAGELDPGKRAKNAPDLDKYLSLGFNTTYVEYQGRGHDDFYDEILRMFEWMSKFHRNFFPRDFACKTMRPWDNYFWWVEIRGLPPKSLVEPGAGAQPAKVEAKITETNGLNVRTGTTQATIWLSPKMIDFKQRSIITVNGKRVNPPDQMIRADLKTLLEDVRTRGDRQHPFWARIDTSTGRVYGEQ